MKNPAKPLIKPLGIQKTTLDKLLKPKKSKSLIDCVYYQKNKERKKAQQKKNYIKKKQQTQEQLNKYYQSSAIKVLMSLKEYTELNQVKRKIWLNFVWILKDLTESGSINNIIQVMKLREEADNLIKDYRATAKNEIRRGESWNSLSEEQKEKLIRYWSQEKVRKDKQLLSELEQQELTGKTYEQEIELAKFHEERGKIKCPCYACETSKELQTKIKQELFKEDGNNKEQCPECKKWVKELDEETGICKNCLENYA